MSFQKITISLLFLFLSQAHSKELVFVGGLSESLPFIIQSGITQNATMELGAQGGLTLRLPFHSFQDRFLFEVGAQYSLRRYAINTSTVYGFSFIEVPIVAKFTLGNTFEVGLGGYFNVGIGQVAVTTVSGTTSTTVPADYSSLTLGQFDYGVVGSLAAKIKTGTFTYIIFDLRYLFSAGNMDTTSGRLLNFRAVELLGGFAVLI
jgi:hypothetical protein